MAKHWVLIAAVASLWAGAVQATPILYNAVLSGAAESPPNASPGSGTAAVTYDPLAHTLTVDAMFLGLIGSTTAAHIHCCTAVPGTGTVGVATPTPTFPGFPLGVTSGTYYQLFDLTNTANFNAAFVSANGGTAAGAESALAAGLASGSAYFNIHTTFVPSGEIRGFLTASSVPEPATLSLLGLGLGALAAASRKKPAV